MEGDGEVDDDDDDEIKFKGDCDKTSMLEDCDSDGRCERERVDDE